MAGYLGPGDDIANAVANAAGSYAGTYADYVTPDGKPSSGGFLDGVGNAVHETAMQVGGHRKTYSRNGQLYFVGGGKVPAAQAAKLKAAAKKAAAAQAKAKNAGRAQRTPAAGSGGGSSYAAASTPAGAADLGSFGAPDERNVSRIVDSIIADATKQSRWAAQDARRQAQGDIKSVAEGTLALDQLAQVQSAANKGYTDRMLAQTNAGAANELVFMQQHRKDLDSSGGGTPMEYAVASADAAGGAAAAPVEISQMGAANQSFFDMSRMANAQSAQESGRNIRSGYAQELATNQRAIAAERAKRALYEQQVRKDLMDQHIAKKMAQAEWAQRGSNLQNDAVSREGAVAQRQQAQAERGYKDYEIMNSIVMGTGTPYEKDTGRVDAKGNPIYIKAVAPMGQASTLQEAIRRVRLAGLGTPANLQNLNQLWQELKSQEFNAGASAVGSGLAGLF